jgi:hypothetical protein
MLYRSLKILSLAVVLVACAETATPSPTLKPKPTLAQPPTFTPLPTLTRQPTEARPTDTLRPGALTATNAPALTPFPAAWQDWPIVPTISDRARSIYARGQALGRDPHKFAKVGDCGGTPSWFLGPFDGDPELYRLGDYTYLQDTITFFGGSFERLSVAAQPGFNASSIFSPLWADAAQCRPNEGPLICEIRVTNASYAFIMLGANDVWHPDNFEPEMRRAIEDLMERGVVPILATKADNIEQDGSINATIVRLAQEYDLPLWNFWRAVNPLPDHGLQEDGVHLTWAGNRFDDPKAMSQGWPMRNLTALQALDAVWRGMTGR